MPQPAEPAGLLIKTPAPPLNAIVLPSPGFVPPILLTPLGSPTWIWMPREVLGIGKVPVMSVPIRLPWMIHPPPASPIKMPVLPPEITFPAPAAAPPIVLFVAPFPVAMPIKKPRPAVPVASVPIRLP